MSDTAIRVENLSKRYRIGLKEEHQDTLVGSALSTLRQPLANLRRLRALSRFSEDGSEPDDVIWALKDVSFEVEQGEVVGIIGRNGAGKTTLLKILARITHPTTGRVELQGRVSSLLEIGTGFHPELTGRENIYLNGTILGMRKAEIDRKFDEIVDFSGVEKFLDTPVKRYSSGMRVRLAFSVAAHLEPEILLVDEVLAVGDTEFQKKCLGKMDDVAGEGRTVLFVSHQMATMRTLCPRSMLLEEGEIKSYGNTEEVVYQYLYEYNTVEDIDLDKRDDRSGDGHFRFIQVRLFDKYGNALNEVTSGDQLQIEIDYLVSGMINESSMIISVQFKDSFGEIVSQFVSDELGVLSANFGKEGTIFLKIPHLTLRGGEYSLRLWASSPDTHLDNLHDAIDGASTLRINPGDYWKTGKLNRSGSYAIIDATMKISPFV